MERLNISEEEVKKRISKQMPIENYIKLADFIIKNNEINNIKIFKINIQSLHILFYNVYQII